MRTIILLLTLCLGQAAFKVAKIGSAVMQGGHSAVSGDARCGEGVAALSVGLRRG